MKHLESTLQAILTRRENAGKLRRLTINDPNKVDFSSNDYLSLSQDAEVQREILSRLESRIAATENGRLSQGILGSGGSRLLDGNSSFAEEVEQKIARFHRSPAALLFNSAYDANIGLLSCVPQPEDVVLYDEAIHASMHDGMRLSRASRCISFSHESVVSRLDDKPVEHAIPSLEETLQRITIGDDGRRAKEGTINVFICVEGVYSMDGCVAQLKEVVSLVEKYLPCQNGYIIVDEAHSVGIFGHRGRGLVSELGLEQKVWARVHGFGKAIGCTGGIVLCSDTVRSYLINYARTLIYTTAMSYSTLVSIDVVHDYMGKGRTEWRMQHLKDLSCHIYRLLEALSVRLSTTRGLLRIQQRAASSPIIPIYTTRPRQLAAYCQMNGLMVRPIMPPTVPIGTERVRVCLHAGNTMAQVEKLINVINDWVQEQQKMENVEKENCRHMSGLTRQMANQSKL